ncbi:cobalt transporter [Mycobacterium goodii]|nr:cobalt transporter [Mycolicibacterium goodii]
MRRPRWRRVRMRTMAATSELTPTRRAVLARRIRMFVAATITYNVIEAVVALTEGARVSSTALIGFGLDSVIEVSSAAAVAWQFAGRDPEAREKVALRIIAFSFFGLATYVAVDAIRSLLGIGEAQHSTIGIALAALSLVIMPVLSYAQRRAGRELGSLSAVADSKQTLLCTYLSAVLLVGLLLNSILGWSWADPIAGLVIAAVAVREGLEAWKGDTCCSAG